MEGENKTKQNTGDPFTQLMFGSRRTPEEVDKQPANGPDLDYDELMNNIGTLMDSVSNLKPVFQKVLPIVRQMWKKS